MVAFNDITRAVDLKRESFTIANALTLLDREGKIVGVVIETEGLITGSVRPLLVQMRDNMATQAQQTGAPANSAIIDTTGWTYPQQMIESIKQQLTQRMSAIDAELEEIGITDLPSL